MKRMHISFEVFPPKKEGDFEQAFEIVRTLSEYNPKYISVTYGAGGSKSKKTLDIASYIQKECRTSAVAHLTCVGSTRKEILARCKELKEHNISYVLALRGDRPKDMSDQQFNSREFAYAMDLIAFLKENSSLAIMASCYPEKHVESNSIEEDLYYMKEKQNLGVKSFISQMFFDNELFYDFMDKAAAKGISVPIHAGIMPVTSAKQLGTSVSLSGCSVPKKLADVIARYGANSADMRKAGIEYATKQIEGLKRQGVAGVHIYTMNKPEVAAEMIRSL
ncbi:MAG: methylenetetrahydrofolate reductase [NAD(P)H] [Lachnospiraceae bacterium]|nr:methylenetetrahydrofolate reductase [NAD(P)H] [Lachnospiraceae bacterium]